MQGEEDQVHFDFASVHALTLITKNPADFKALHELDQDHSGILAAYQDNDPSRDMGDADIVRAIENLGTIANQGGLPIQGGFHFHNDWQY